jgi:predicted dienelactone hydrolase
MTLAEWTASASAVDKARKLMHGTTFRAMVEVLRDEAPLVRVPLPFGSTATDYAYAHGMQKGYEFALKILKATGETTPEIPEEPEATFSRSNNNE